MFFSISVLTPNPLPPAPKMEKIFFFIFTQFSMICQKKNLFLFLYEMTFYNCKKNRGPSYNEKKVKDFLDELEYLKDIF